MPQKPERTASGEAVTQLILNTFRLHGLLGAAGDALTVPWDLTAAKWKVLGAVSQAERPVHVSQIGRNMGLTRQGVQRSVNELERSGLVELVDNPDHRRARLVQLTARGTTVYREVMAAQIVWSNELADGVSERTIRTASRVMTTLIDRLNNKST